MTLYRPIFLCIAALSVSAATHSAEKKNWTAKPTPAPDASSASPTEAPAPTPAQLTATEIDAQLSLILSARSYPEAHPAMEALFNQEKAFPRLEQLLSEPKLHPEVRYYLIESMVRMPFPAAVVLAGRLVKDEDRDVRVKSLRRLQQDGDVRFRDNLMDAALAEKEDELRGEILMALGRTDAKAIPFLEGYLKKGQNPVVLNGVVRALSELKSNSSAVKALAVLTEDLPTFAVDEILDACHVMVGSPTNEKLIAMASNPKDPLRLYAVNQLYSSLPAAESVPMRAALQAAALSAIDDPDALIRWRAVRSYHRLFETPCGYISDRKALTKTVAIEKDSSPRVRLALIESLHNTALRRGLVAPNTQPSALDAETMQMLRWPLDWQVFPLLVNLLDDPEPAVREKAIWMLGITTGYFHGYSDIRLLGTPQITPDVKAQYRAMWDAMKDKSAAAVTREIVDQTIQRLQRPSSPISQRNWFRGIHIVTGRTFGWRANGTTEEKNSAVAALAAWWQNNSQKHPAQWIVDLVKESGAKAVDPLSMHALGRWAPVPFDTEHFFNQILLKNDPDEISRRIFSWWDTVKSDVEPSPSPSSSH